MYFVLYLRATSFETLTMETDEDTERIFVVCISESVLISEPFVTPLFGNLRSFKSLFKLNIVHNLISSTELDYSLLV